MTYLTDPDVDLERFRSLNHDIVTICEGLDCITEWRLCCVNCGLLGERFTPGGTCHHFVTETIQTAMDFTLLVSTTSVPTPRATSSRPSRWARKPLTRPRLRAL
jgi:hypothetical protein